MYLEQYDRLDAQLRDRAKDNVPTERRRAGFVSHVELQMVRKKLAVGSKERLLLSIERMCFQRFCNQIHVCLMVRKKLAVGSKERCCCLSNVCAFRDFATTSMHVYY